MSVWDRAERLSDERIDLEDLRHRTQLRQACESHYQDLVKFQKTKLRSLLLINEDMRPLRW